MYLKKQGAALILKQVSFWKVSVVYFHAPHQLQPLDGQWDGEFCTAGNVCRKAFAFGLVHTFFKARLQMEEYNILGHMWLNMYLCE